LHPNHVSEAHKPPLPVLFSLDAFKESTSHAKGIRSPRASDWVRQLVDFNQLDDEWENG
jgi:hypothetical protein